MDQRIETVSFLGFNLFSNSNQSHSKILVNQSKYKQVFMLDLTQDKRKAMADNNVIKKTYADLALGSQNILVSAVNSNLLTTNSNNISQQPQAQQFSLVHPNTLQKPIIISTSSAGGAGTLIQSSQATNTGNKIIVSPSPQISGNVYVSTHGAKLVIPSSNNSQSIILDPSKMIPTNNLQTTHQQRIKMENKMNMLRDSSVSSVEKNIIYKYTSKNNKLMQSVASIIPMQATGNKSGIQTQTQVVKPIASSPQQSIGIISNNKAIQRIQQQQQILRPQYGTSSVNFQSSPTSSKIIQQPNNGNNILGSVNNNDSSQVNSTTPR